MVEMLQVDVVLVLVVDCPLSVSLFLCPPLSVCVASPRCSECVCGCFFLICEVLLVVR